MPTAEPPDGVALRAAEATYIRARCRHDGQTILREAAWSIRAGRVLPLAGYPWIHAETGEAECPAAVDLADTDPQRTPVGREQEDPHGWQVEPW